MCDLAFNHEPPGRHAAGTNRRAEVGAIDPVERAILQMRELAVFDESVDAHPAGIRHLLVGNEHGDHGMIEFNLGLGQLGKEIGQHSNMSQAVGHPSTIEPVSFELELKGRALPLGRVCRYHIEVSTNKGDSASGFAGVSEDLVTPTLD